MDGRVQVRGESHEPSARSTEPVLRARQTFGLLVSCSIWALSALVVVVLLIFLSGDFSWF
jgi:hypothetical protein